MAFGRKDRKTDHSEVELLRSLVSLARQLQSSLELDAIARVIAKALGETFGFREASIYLVDADGETFRVHATVGQHPDYDAELYERPVPLRVLQQFFLPEYRVGDSSYFVDERIHTWTQEQLYYFPPLDLGRRRHDEWRENDDLFVPLFDKMHRLMGVLDLYDPVDRALPTAERVASLEVFATHAAVALENARQYRELEAATGELAAQLELRHGLIDLSAALLTTFDTRELFARIAALLKEIVDYDAMEIRLVDEAARELYCGFASDEDVEQMSCWRAPLNVGVSGWVVTHNEAQLVNDMLADPRGALVPGTEWVPQASIIAPLTVGGSVIGVLAVDRMGGRTFAESELEPARLFANMAAIAIQNARTYEELERQAICDGLTGIHNYRHFQETLSAEVSRAERYGETFCLLMMDLDHFKAVNDTIGHQKGDEVLCAVSAALSSCSRESDYLARYGGEEFTMILPRTGLEEAATLAERIREGVAAIDIVPQSVRVTMSIGVAAYPTSAATADGVLGAADAALLRAKASGRDRVFLHAEGQDGRATTLRGDLVTVGRRFAAFIGLSEAETAGLVTALAVVEKDAGVQQEVRAVLGSGQNGGARPDAVRSRAVDALVYGSERWDGSGYPEGLSGSAIPRVARAFAVCRCYDEGANDGGTLESLRAASARDLDPGMVQRFAAMLRAEEAGRV